MLTRGMRGRQHGSRWERRPARRPAVGVAVTRYSPSRDEVRNPNRTELLKPTRSFPDISGYAFPARQIRQRSLTVTVGHVKGPDTWGIGNA